MRLQGLKSTRKKTPDTDLDENCKTNVVFNTTMDPSTIKEGGNYSQLCERLSITPNKGNKYIYVIYVCYCNSIMITLMKNRSDKEMICAFTSLTKYLKSHGIIPGLQFMDNKASIAFNMEMTTIDVSYQLVPPSNHRANNA